MDINQYSKTYLILFFFLVSMSMFAQHRSYDGYGNNVISPHFGAAEAELRYITPRSFSDGISTPTGVDRPNPRVISNVLFAQPEYIYDEHELSDFIWVFGQFIDHDITLVRDSGSEPAFIPVPACDPVFDPSCLGQSLIMMMRSNAMDGTGTDPNNPRSYTNQVSAFIDGSGIYGSSEKRAAWLRTFNEGKLKVSEGNLLPFNTLNGELNGVTDPLAPEMDHSDSDARRYFVAGDVRANENVMLLAMHTLFVREHNRICEELKLKYPNGTDEQLYQKARKMVGGMLQAITYNEWLPAMGVLLDEYGGYRSDVNPGITNIFSAAAFRFGHTLLSHDLLRMDDGCETVAQGDMKLRDAFFNPEILISSGLDPLVKGMSAQIQQALDCKVVDDVRNFLFGPPGSSFGLDLAAININRGRERGLMDYNSIRDVIGIGKVRSFEEICEKPDDAKVLESLYLDVNRIDPWVGMLAEIHMPGAIFGESIMTIIKEQFRALRDGDRFFYRVDPQLSAEEVEVIEASSLSKIIKRNTNLEALQENVFLMQRICNKVEIAEKHLEVSVFPNPVRSDFDLTLFSFKEDDATLIIRNMMGQEVVQQNLSIVRGINAFKHRLPKSLAPGTYLMEVIMGYDRTTAKLLKSD